MFMQHMAMSLATMILIASTFLVVAPTGSSRLFAQGGGLVPGPPQSIAFNSTRDGGSLLEVYVMDPNGGNQINKTNLPTAGDRQGEVSPNGTEIVFVSTRDGNAEVFLMDSDGTNIRQLTNTVGPAACNWPRWSPDGEWIAFHLGVDTATQIYRIRRDGSELTQVTNHPGFNAYSAWSPDGTRLAIRRDNDIYLINSADGDAPDRLTDVGTNNQMPAFSPDGMKIAFLSNRDGYASIFVMNSDGSEQVNFTPRPAGRTTGWGSRAPAWSPNGEFIYFTAVRSVETGHSREQIWVKPVAGDTETQLTDSLGANTEPTVRRIAAPTITSLTATPDVLWPINNKMIPVMLTVDVSDTSDPAPICLITDVSSNEPTPDLSSQITGPLTLDLLATRFGTGSGRVYKITVTCSNTSDLAFTAVVSVTVPHDQRGEDLLSYEAKLADGL